MGEVWDTLPAVSCLSYENRQLHEGQTADDRTVLLSLLGEPTLHVGNNRNCTTKIDLAPEWEAINPTMLPAAGGHIYSIYHTEPSSLREAPHQRPQLERRSKLRRLLLLS